MFNKATFPEIVAWLNLLVVGGEGSFLLAYSRLDKKLHDMELRHLHVLGPILIMS